MRRARVCLAALFALAVAVSVLAPTAAGAGPSATPPTAWFRMAHFARDVPPVDLYLVPKASGPQQLMLRGLAYGGVSPYLTIDPGVYTANVRLAGADPASAPAFTGSADIVAGSAYTFAAFGQAANVTQRLLTDDLTPPAAGQASVRVVQAADVSVQTDVVGSVDPATITAYTAVPAGRPVVNVTPVGGPTVTQPVALAAGSVHSLLVLRRGANLEVADIVDTFTAAGPAPGGNAAGGTVVAGTLQLPASGRPELPRTGAELGLLAALAVVMIGVGHGMMVASRR